MVAKTETTSLPVPLWGNKKLPVVGVTGEYGSGKTLFMLTIDPDCFDKSKPPRTLAWGTEDGLTPYEDTFAFDHRSLTDVMLRPGYRPEHLYLEWLKQMRSIKSGQYRVGCLDTVSEIEGGLVSWIRQHPEHFSHTRAQYARMEGLLWGDVKSLWKQHLSEAASRFECFAFSSHTKIVWKGKEPTQEKTAKGKQTLWELASLYLWLDRTPKIKSKSAPSRPTGTIFQGKNRLVWRNPTTGELEPILPPRLPIATPDAIRAYIKKPCDYTNLKVGERLEAEKEMSEDERLMVKASIASDQAASSAADLSRVEMMRQSAAAQASTMAVPPAVPPATTTTTSALPATNPSDPAAYSEPVRDGSSISPDQRERIIRLFQFLEIDQTTAKQIIANRNCQSLADMDFAGANELIEKLVEKTGNAEIPF